MRRGWSRWNKTGATVHRISEALVCHNSFGVDLCFWLGRNVHARRSAFFRVSRTCRPGDGLTAETPFEFLPGEKINASLFFFSGAVICGWLGEVSARR